MCKIYGNLDLENEIWIEIDGYDGDYQISNFGRVKSFKCNKERILEPWIDSGYYIVCLSKNKKGKNKLIHVLMYTHFISKIPEGCVIHHIDKTKDNFMSNLQVMSKSEHHSLHNKNKIVSENTKELISKQMSGEHHPKSTLKEKQVIQIHMLKKLGFKNIELSKKYNVSQIVISRIKTGKRWKHIYKQFNK